MIISTKWQSQDRDGAFERGSTVLNFALVGCGRIAVRHSELLGNNHIKNARLTAVCDMVEEKARRIGGAFSVPWFTDMHEMMRNANTDVVVVLTESGRHAEHVI